MRGNFRPEPVVIFTEIRTMVMKISQKESGMYLGVVIAIVVVLLTLILRSFKPIVVSVFVFIFSVIAAMALSGMMGWKLTPFTASVPMIVLILAVADCVHFVTTFVHRLHQGEEKRAALIGALELNFKLIAITSITTAIGFLTLNLSESGSIGALGSQVAFGVMFAFALSVTFLPAVLALLPFKTRVATRESTPYFAGAAGLLYRYRSMLLAASLVVSAGLAYCLTLNEFNDKLPTYFAKTLPWRQANDCSEEQFGGAYTFSYSLDSGASDGVADPEFLMKVERFATWLRSLPESVYVNSVVDTFKRLNRSMHGDDDRYYRLPEHRQLASQYLLLYEMSLPYGLDLNDQINLDRSATKVLATFRTLSTTQILALERRVDEWLGQNLPGVTATGSGVQMMFAHLLDQDTRGLIWGAGLGLLVISFLLIFALRSVRLGLISIAPNILPAVMAFGVWGLFVGEIGMGMAMVSGMTIGIIVDDTVHFLSKYIKARSEQGLDSVAAVDYAFETVGPSIVVTTVVLVAGFMAMANLAEFRVNSDMGKMTSIILVFALDFDLVALPILLMLFDSTRATSRSKDQAQLNAPRA